MEESCLTKFLENCIRDEQGESISLNRQKRGQDIDKTNGINITITKLRLPKHLNKFSGIIYT